MKLRRLFLTFAILMGVFATAGAAVKGDATGDGVVDVADVNQVINIMLGQAEANAAADVTGDGSIDVADVNLIVNIMLGTDNSKTFETMDDLYVAINDCEHAMMKQYLLTQGMSGEGCIMMWYGNYPGQDFFFNMPGWASLVNQDVHDTPDSKYSYYPWYYYYGLIALANKVIVHYDEPEGYDDQKLFVKAQALTYRAYAYTMLAQLYAKRWVDSQNGASSGVVLRLDESTAELPVATLAETYAQIYRDLDDALVAYQQSGRSRVFTDDFYQFYLPDADVAHAVYARAALARNDWSKASLHALLAQQNHPLMDNYTLRTTGFCTANSEWIWGGQSTDHLYYYSYHAYIAYNSNASNVRIYPRCISRELFNKIPATDVRRQWWLDPTGYEYNTDNGRADRGAQLDTDARAAHPDLNENAYVYAYMQWKVRTVEQPGIADLCFIRASEMLLIQAEAQCMLGNDIRARDALWTLNYMSGRDPNYLSDKMGAELLEEVKLYRRIELWGEGFDWFDLKRWKEPLVRHTYADGGNFITDFAVTITPDEKNEWTFQIPNPEVLPQE